MKNFYNNLKIIILLKKPGMTENFGILIKKLKNLKKII